MVTLISIGFISENALHHRFIRKGVPQIFKVIFSFSEQYRFYQETEQGVSVRQVKAKAKDEQPQTCILIIGESLNRNHLSLYGYPKNTSPKLSQRKDIIVYKNTVSAYSNTINSVLSILSESNLENQLKPEEYIHIFDIFSSAQFQTYWLSNQAPYGIWENKVTSLAKKSNHYQCINMASNSSMESTTTSAYDEHLIPPFKKILQTKEPKKLIIIHLMGNHTSYRKRYPKEFEKFKGYSSKEKTIAQYDNSVLYNDDVVNSLFNIIEQYSETHSCIVSAIYLSDHGENVYDEGDNVEHNYSRTLPKANVEIPFIVWLSKTFKKQYPQQSSIIKTTAKNLLFLTIYSIAL